MAASIPTIVVDTREQTPWPLNVPWMRATVPTGADYSLEGFEQVIGIERKSLEDLVASLIHNRERFLRSLEALRTRPWRALIVEAQLEDVLAGRYRSRANPNAVLGAVCAAIADGCPIYFAGNPNAAAVLAERLLVKFHKRAFAAQERAA